MQRGNVFQHVFILLMVELGIEAFFREESFVWAEGMWQPMLLVWTALTLCFCEFIIREITPMGNVMGAFYTVMGIAGIFIMAVCGSRILMGEEAFVSGYTLTRCGSEMIESGLMILIFLVFLGKKAYNHWRGEREDEE